jgi:hypothetical protein
MAYTLKGITTTAPTRGRVRIGPPRAGGLPNLGNIDINLDNPRSDSNPNTRLRYGRKGKLIGIGAKKILAGKVQMRPPTYVSGPPSVTRVTSASKMRPADGSVGGIRKPR